MRGFADGFYKSGKRIRDSDTSDASINQKFLADVPPWSCKGEIEEATGGWGPCGLKQKTPLRKMVEPARMSMEDKKSPRRDLRRTGPEFAATKANTGWIGEGKKKKKDLTSVFVNTYLHTYLGT